MKQIPLLEVSPDERMVLHLIDRTYPCRSLELRDLFGCWRPGGPRAPWPDRKVSKVLTDLESRGLVMRSVGLRGDVLQVAA